MSEALSSPLSQYIPAFARPKSPQDVSDPRTYDLTACLRSVLGDFILTVPEPTATVVRVDGTVNDLVISGVTVGSNAAGTTDQVINALHSGGTDGAWYRVSWAFNTNSGRSLTRSAYLLVAQL